MSFLDAIRGGVSLKHTTTKVENDQKAFEPQLCESSQQYLEKLSEAYFENWFETLADVTFRSTSGAKISVSAAAAIGSCHNYWKETGKVEWKQHQCLVDLAEFIDKEIQQLGSKRVFVRMSTRSPKDAALESPNILDEMKVAYQELQQFENSSSIYTSIWNKIIHALYTASIKVLAISTGAEAIDLFVQSNRVQDDLQRAAETNFSDLSMIVREFSDFDPQFELRAFIYNGKFTALTQYNEFNKFPKLLSMKQTVEEHVRHFVEGTIIPRLSSMMKDFILDIVLIPSTSSNSINGLEAVIIEVNPIGEFAGTGLFDWLKDKPVILGQKPFEFRCQTNDLAESGDLGGMDPKWAALVRKFESVQPQR